jgi:hypothetical protein
MTLDQTADLLAAARMRIVELEDRIKWLEVFAPKTWETKFPHVRFTDKVTVTYGDGRSETFKHLYNSDYELQFVDWDTVVNCYEV